jgi:3-deoxy-D-manno-octulosonic-acid transferase
MYRALARAADLLLPLGAAFSSKLALGDRERRSALERWERWAAAARDRTRPLVWCHAPSVGEGLQAQAVLGRLRARHPEWQIGYSFFSPSARDLASRQPADVADYLPYDTRLNAERLLDALAPTALVFTKLDLWPELAATARERGVRVGMIAATVSPISRRLRGPARTLTRPGYASLERVGAVAPADGDRLRALGVDPAAIRVTGDPRFDSALERAGAVADTDPMLRFGREAPTLVAGSTWPADEATLLPAFARVLRARPDARLILVPHEPTPRHLAAAIAAAGDAGLEPVLLSAAVDGGPVPLLVVDRVGVLTSFYRSATIGYVGGGFGRSGLHSVLEPAAAGVPVLFGPRWHSSREAGLLLDAAAAQALAEPAGARAAAELAAVWLDWLDHPSALSERGARAHEVVVAGLGGADRNAALVEELVGA